MSQPPNSVLNGPSPIHVPSSKDVQPFQDMTKPVGSGVYQQLSGTATYSQPIGNLYPQPIGNVVYTQPSRNDSHPQQPTYTIPSRPQLVRIDSRSTVPPRPPFLNQPGLPLRPPQIRQAAPPQFRPPLTRPPGQPVQYVNPQPRLNTIFRPPTPFPRPQIGQRPPGVIFQQRSVPSYWQPRPTFEGDIVRSKTLDSSSLVEDGRYRNESEIERRRSIESLEGRKSQSGSTENLDKKSDSSDHSRPGSRTGFRMNPIVEDEYKGLSSSPPQEPQKIIEMSTVNRSKSPIPNKIEDRSGETNQSYFRPEEILKNNTYNKKEADLEERIVIKPKTSTKTEGDNDSGVDESTQGNDQSSNGYHGSQWKSSDKPTRTSSTTPTKNRSLSRGSKSPSLKSPDSTATTPGATEKKKIPMNKVQVGSAPSPNLKVVRSKIGSLENASYKPGGGNVKIETKKLDFKKAGPRIEAKNDKYLPKGGEKKIQQQKLQWNAKSKIGSLENTTHKPKGGDKKIESIKLDFKDKAKPKVGSKDNVKYVPGGGDVKFDDNHEENIKGEIENKKLDIKAQSKVGSMDNMKHKPGGGDKKIFDDKDYLKQRSALTSENHSLAGSQNSLPSQPEVGGPIADENLNRKR